MNKIFLKTVIVSIPLILCGCVSSTSPIKVEPQSNRTGLGETVILGGSTAVGALGGYSVTGDSTGAVIGAGLGLASGAIVNNVMTGRREQREAEIFEAGQREARASLMDEFWNAERYRRLDQSSTIRQFNGADESVRYPGGHYEGINVAPRSGSSEMPLTEPRRHN